MITGVRCSTGPAGAATASVTPLRTDPGIWLLMGSVAGQVVRRASCPS